MAAPKEAPEQVIRRWLEQNGPATVGLGAIAQTWQLDRLGDEDRREIAAALEAAGVVVEPPLDEAGRKDKLRQSLVEEAVVEAEPEAEPEAEAEPEPEAEPAPAPRAASPPPPLTSPSQPEAPSRRRRAPLRRFRHLLPQSGRPPVSAPPPAASESPSPPREPVPEVEPEMPPGVDHDYELPPEPEIEPAPEPDTEPEIPPAPEPPPAPDPPAEPDIPPPPEPLPDDAEADAADDDPLTRMEGDPASTARGERRRRRQERRATGGRKRPRRRGRAQLRTEVAAESARPEPSPARPGREPSGRSERPLAFRLIPAALALMVVGSLGPWAESILVTDYGIDRAGYVVMAVALVAGLVVLLHARVGRRSPLPLLAALLATAAVVVVAADFRELVDDQFVGPAWGLYAAFAGSAALVALSMSLLARRS